MIKAITFDFWDTLYRIPAGSQIGRQRALDVRETLLQMGYEASLEDISAAFKAAWSKAAYYQRTHGEEITPYGHLKYVQQKLGLELSPDEMEKAYDAYTNTALFVPPEINDSVLQTLPLLCEKYRLAIICNTGATPGSVLRKIVQKDGLSKYFCFMVFSDEVGFAKPNIKIFQYTLEHLQVYNHQAAHIGDDLTTDIAGAKKAGMKAVWLAPDQEKVKSEADYHVHRVGELLDLFD